MYIRELALLIHACMKSGKKCLIITVNETLSFFDAFTPVYTITPDTMMKDTVYFSAILYFIYVTERTYERISFDASIAFDVGEVNALQFLTIHLLLTTVLYVI